MLPTLIKLGPLELSSFGTIIAVGFIAFAFVIWRLGRDRGFLETPLFDHLMVTAFMSFIGARLFYVIFHWSLFAEQFIRIFVMWRFPGLSSTGAFLIGLVFFYLYARRVKLPLGDMWDIYGRALPVAVFFISLAVFLDGTVIGRETGAFWGLAAVGYPGRRHPVGLYGMVLAVLMGLMLVLSTRRMSHKQVNKVGIIGWVSICLFGFIELLLAITRQDLLYWLGVSVEMLVAVLTIAIPLGPLYVLLEGGKYVGVFKRNLVNIMKRGRK